MRRAAFGPLLLLVLLAAPCARAEVVAGGVHDAALAEAADGSPRVAYVAGGRIHVATRGADGWRQTTGPRLRGSTGSVVGIAARGALTAALVEDDRGRWLALYLARGRSTPLRLLVVAAKGARLGVAGLALDRRGNPVVAYAFRLSNRNTYLRLVRCATRCVDRRVTRAGFPASEVPPGVAPVVMPNRTIRVVETYAHGMSAAIEWRPQRRDWIGRFIFANTLGTPLGLVRALVFGGDLYASWTQAYPEFGESHVVLTRHYLGVHDPQEETAVVLRHAALVDVVRGPDGLEVGANDWATVDDAAVEAGVLAFPGLDPVELDGALLGYGSGAGGARDVLLWSDGVLSWYRRPTRPAVRVSLTAFAAGAVTLSGRVAGAGGGSVSLYRERPRQLLAEVPVAADGSFSAVAPDPGAPTLYRAVFREPLTGLPYAALLRTPVG